MADAFVPPAVLFSSPERPQIAMRGGEKHISFSSYEPQKAVKDHSVQHIRLSFAPPPFEILDLRPDDFAEEEEQRSRIAVRR